ncbi:MAG TPA: bifunctional methylenetetrahydrofolate dehydrogenase/methenyltetrahydrofolate cyclohydrolase FolD [Candidatus Scatosoma pullicola]|nr:bifunctional methylenetetrahydrofolate dehydrogenase/methenyltetrahydrofolate cyclohydrolase FolD [Candidatus Scatosoma pullicola]
MKIIDGKAVAADIRAQLKDRIGRSGKEVGLAVVMVGDNPASRVYVRNKEKACRETGILSRTYELPEGVSQPELEALIVSLAADERVHGILLQLPLPEGLDAGSALAKIPPSKDVDGFSAENLGKLVRGERALVACTPLGVMKLLESAGISPAGKRAVVLGRSETVGKPLALLFLNADATVTVCHSRTENLKEICREADILVSAVGKPGFVTEDMVKEGAVVIDVGINRGADGKLCGDVDFERVAPRTSYITPVPGGVGPMTVAMLLCNTAAAAMEE